MKYKKITALVLAATMCAGLAFTSCSNADRNVADETTTVAEETSEATTVTEIEETTEETTEETIVEETTLEESEETDVQIEFDGEALYNEHYSESEYNISNIGITDQENIVTGFWSNTTDSFHAEYLYETPELAREDAEAWIALQEDETVYEVIDGVPTYTFESGSTLEIYGSLLICHIPY